MNKTAGLEIPIEVTVKWEDRRAMDILHKKVEMSYPLGDNDRYIDESTILTMYRLTRTER